MPEQQPFDIRCNTCVRDEFWGQLNGATYLLFDGIEEAAQPLVDKMADIDRAPRLSPLGLPLPPVPPSEKSVSDMNELLGDVASLRTGVETVRDKAARVDCEPYRCEGRCPRLEMLLGALANMHTQSHVLQRRWKRRLGSP